MSLYARSDLQVQCIPASSGGCGAVHERPSRNGTLVKTWRLDCAPCEGYLRGASRPKILKQTPGDLKAGIPGRQEWVADADPHWSSTPESVPQTPDELAISSVRAERGALQLQLMQALAAVRATGVEVPPEAMWLLERDLPPQVMRGVKICPAGHDNSAGTKFCSECGLSMAAVAAPVLEIETEAPDLRSLHPQTLRKMCRDQGLPDRGTREELAARLEAA